jgi:uncharacterized protein involved in exopolysaccharide biosynthesis
VLILVPAITYALRIPNVYDAWAQIYISKETPAAGAAQGFSLVGENYGNPYLVEKTLLHDQYLEKVALKLDPSLHDAGPLQMASALIALQRKITISPDEGDGFFEFHVRDRDPVKAKTIAKLILDEFVSRNMNHNQEQLRTAGAFIDAQLASYQNLLAASQARIAEFRARNPSVGAVSVATNPFAAASDLPAAREAYQAALAAVGAPDREQLARADEAVLAAKAKLAALRTQYTDQHPDVIAAKRQLAQATADRAATAAAPPPALSSSPALDEARRRLAQAESSPGVRITPGLPPTLKAEWNDLLKNDEALHSSYQELLTRRETARVSEAVYSGDSAGKYQVVQEPTTPEFPLSAKRPLYLAASVILALGGGLAAAYVCAAINGIFVSPRELERAFELPVVGTVSWEPAWNTKSSARMRNLFSTGANRRGGSSMTNRSAG